MPCRVLIKAMNCCYLSNISKHVFPKQGDLAPASVPIPSIEIIIDASLDFNVVFWQSEGKTVSPEAVSRNARQQTGD